MQAVGSYYWFYSWGHQKLRNQVPISDSEKVGTMSGQFKISKVCITQSSSTSTQAQGWNIGLRYQLLLGWPWAWSIRNKQSKKQSSSTSTQAQGHQFLACLIWYHHWQSKWGLSLTICWYNFHILNHRWLPRQKKTDRRKLRSCPMVCWQSWESYRMHKKQIAATSEFIFHAASLAK